MQAARLAGLLPPLKPAEALEATMVQSVAGNLTYGGLIQNRPFREPHHAASMAARVGGGLRANHHVTYPARFQLVAAMNPCRCGYLGDPARACSRAPVCGQNYQAKISGPMMDRFDLIIEVPEISAGILLKEASGESSQIVAARVTTARQFGTLRNQGVMRANAHIGIDQLDQQIIMDDTAQNLLRTAMDQANLSAHAYHKIMRVSRTIADLAGDARVGRAALAEALAYRAMPLLA
jgi:magnesium chelatase family protein